MLQLGLLVESLVRHLRTAFSRGRCTIFLIEVYGDSRTFVQELFLFEVDGRGALVVELDIETFKLCRDHIFIQVALVTIVHGVVLVELQRTQLVVRLLDLIVVKDTFVG